MNEYSYAKLGTYCQSSPDTLVSNRKFLPVEAKEYLNITATRMDQYPATDQMKYMYVQHSKPTPPPTAPAEPYKRGGCPCGK